MFSRGRTIGPLGAPLFGVENRQRKHTTQSPSEIWFKPVFSVTGPDPQDCLRAMTYNGFVKGFLQATPKNTSRALPDRVLGRFGIFTGMAVESFKYT